MGMELTLGARLRELSGPILITGHTGFKGTWGTLLLERLGVEVVGLSLPAMPGSLFERIRRSDCISETLTDIRNPWEVQKAMDSYKPSVVLHMAAQPLVLESYKSPRETFDTNVMGSVNVLDSAFKTDSVVAVVVVTTDKVYQNSDSTRAYVESDPLSGKDPYSASKVGTEAAVTAWQQISKSIGGPKVISVRAGNVIGGGDWAQDRLIPDLIRNFLAGKSSKLRNPRSTRPWQHVLDPLFGYLMAVEALIEGKEFLTLNFGPSGLSLNVKEVAEIACETWGIESKFGIDALVGEAEIEAESKFLNLDSSRAEDLLGWRPAWSQKEAVTNSIQWWKKVSSGEIMAEIACDADIDTLFKIHGIRN